ncbi:TonB-dependent receptor [Novosphingobium resinovorum]|uniref:TonB-dependent receptor n=1 Tax=Novosphingobium resinovorum TaxID=158500 RepID=A0A031JB53_9SPHN|nr:MULTISPECIES: TonB-dependent receptor [Novosphingobium]AOR76026.1 TonB-dependent receptor [Novosphingobium resinovorum]EZP70487.1 TonB-dependent receptor [Novosphingobium resinovorum]MBF7011407.1 TonB-dependent receptor [Novosphingobium sp. HR1a]WJM29387.1 TonB-dependent receptor [Novosphingobium resinovorum]
MTFRFGATSTMAIATAMLAMPAHAQSGAEAAQAKDAKPEIEEIVVTAQRREQSLSKVPVSVSAFNADVLQDRNVTSEQGLAALVPGLVVKSGQNSNQLSFTLRGQTLDPFSGSSPAVLTYINDAPMTEGNTSTAFFDFSSVQVLKGPQGTLFGRNATGGAILYETTKPGDVFGGYLTIKGGERNYIQAQGAIDLPISDVIKLRLAGDYNKQDGYIRNVNTGSTLGDTDAKSGRVTLVIEPSSGFKMTTVAQYSDFGGTEGAGGLYSYHACGETNNGYQLTATLDCVYGMNSPFAPTLGDGPMGDGTWPGAVAGYLAWQQANPYKVWLSYDLPHKAHTAFVTNTTEMELGDDVMLKNIFSYADAFARTPGILSGSPFGSLNLYNNSGLGNGPPGGEEFSTKRISNELQLQGKSGRLEYIVGAYYSWSRKKEYIPVIVGSELATPLADIAYYYTNDDESKALFAQLSYELTDKLTVTAGGRYTWEQMRLRQNPGSLFNLDGDTPLKQKANLKDPSWTFNIQYQINPQNMVYFAQRGSFRAGGFNGAVVPYNNTNFFKNENTYDFELGYKFNGYIGGVASRVNIAAYRQIVTDAQHSIYALVNGNPAAFTVNVPKKRIQGVEFDGNFRLSEWLEVGFSGAYTDAKFTRNIVDLSAATGVAGLTIPFDTYTDAPKWAGSVYAEVGLPVPESAGEVKFRTDVFGQKMTYFSNNEGSITPRTQLPGYVTVDMRLSWNNVMGSNVTVAGYVKNLFDKLYYNSGYVEGASGGFNTAIWGAPQTFGAEVTYRF